MLQPSIVCSYLLPHYSEIIPDGTINYAWLECAHLEIQRIEDIKLGPMAVHSLLRLLQLMTAAHQHVLQKSGRLCRTCFDEATKNLFVLKVNVLSPWEQKKERLYIHRLEEKPPHWGQRLWERTMKNILERPFVDTITGDGILCCHNGDGHCLESISINAAGERFLWTNNNGKTIELPPIIPPAERPKMEQTSINETMKGISPNEIPQQVEGEKPEKHNMSNSKRQNESKGTIIIKVDDIEKYKDMEAVFYPTEKNIPSHTLIIPAGRYYDASKHLLYVLATTGYFKRYDIEYALSSFGSRSLKDDNRNKVVRTLKDIICSASSGILTVQDVLFLKDGQYGSISCNFMLEGETRASLPNDYGMLEQD